MLASLVIGLFIVRVAAVATPKFSNEITFSSDMNWEPAIAADPNGGIYWAATRNVSQSVCEGCPNPGMSFRYSADNGRVFGTPLWVCMENCVGFPSQYDPVMAVNQRGSLHWAWMNWWNISFARSDDHGQTWAVYHPCIDVAAGDECPDEDGPWGDKPWITAHGDDVYVFYNRAKMMVAHSHDGGLTWARQTLIKNALYFFPTGATVSKLTGVVCASANAEPPNLHRSLMYVFCSTNKGKTWSTSLVDGSFAGPKCPEWAKCNEDEFLIAGITIAFDDSGSLWALYANSTALWQPSRMYLRVSENYGYTWGRAIDVSLASDSTHHAFPMLAAGKAGDVRVAWMDNRTGWWNAWYRETADAGRTWSAEVRLSSATSGAPWQSSTGFKFPYGDYGMLTIDSEGFSHAVWGEGLGWVLSGNCYYARQMSHT